MCEALPRSLYSRPLSGVGSGQGPRVTRQSTSVPPWPAFSDPKPTSLPFGLTPSYVLPGPFGARFWEGSEDTGAGLLPLDVGNTSWVPCGPCGVRWQEPGVRGSPACPKPWFSSAVESATSFSDESSCQQRHRKLRGEVRGLSQCPP